MNRSTLPPRKAEPDAQLREQPRLPQGRYLARRAAIEPLALADAAMGGPPPCQASRIELRDRSDRCRAGGLCPGRAPVSPAGTGTGPRRAVEAARLRNRRWKHPRKHRRNGDNVIPFRPDEGIHRSSAADEISSPCPSPFDQLTAALVLAQYRAGTLPEGVIVALLASAGLQP